jgi:hypothetical protein
VSRDRDSPFLRPFSPFSIVNDQLVSAELRRKHNRIAFAWIQIRQRRVWRIDGRANLEPNRRPTDPSPNYLRRNRSQKFLLDRSRDHNRAVHLWEDIDFFDEKEIL